MGAPERAISRTSGREGGFLAQQQRCDVASFEQRLGDDDEIGAGATGDLGGP